jgi:cell division septation protein DedD
MKGTTVTSTRAMRGAALVGLVVETLVAGCSREKIDGKSAESADTVESYDHFIERHPDSTLATQARARVAQLEEDRDWKQATTRDNADGYKQFLAQHANGKWAEEARIRIESSTLEGNPSPLTMNNSPAPNPAAAAAPPVSAPAPPVSKPAPGPASKPAPVAPSATQGNSASASEAPRSASSSAPTHTATATPHASSSAPVSTAPPAASAAAPDADSKGFGIQLGAFSTQQAALSAWKRLQVAYDAELHGLFAHAVPVHTGTGQLFRLQSPVGDESRARGICAALAKHSQPCVVVLPTP